MVARYSCLSPTSLHALCLPRLQLWRLKLLADSLLRVISLRALSPQGYLYLFQSWLMLAATSRPWARGYGTMLGCLLRPGQFPKEVQTSGPCLARRYVAPAARGRRLITGARPSPPRLASTMLQESLMGQLAVPLHYGIFLELGP